MKTLGHRSRITPIIGQLQHINMPVPIHDEDLPTMISDFWLSTPIIATYGALGTTDPLLILVETREEVPQLRGKGMAANPRHFVGFHTVTDPGAIVRVQFLAKLEGNLDIANLISFLAIQESRRMSRMLALVHLLHRRLRSDIGQVDLDGFRLHYMPVLERMLANSTPIWAPDQDAAQAAFTDGVAMVVAEAETLLKDGELPLDLSFFVELMLGAGIDL